MRILYIDTSSSYLYTAIVEDNKLLGEVKEEFGQSLSEVALPKIVSVFTENNIKPNIILTTTIHDKEMVLNAGADLYLPKPYELSSMFGWIKKFNENYNE